MKDKLLIIAFVLGFGCPVLAQEQEQEQERASLILSSDIVSEYVWRGLKLGSASIQPTLGVEWRGLSLSAWGSVGFVDKDDAREIDLIGSYTTGGFSVGVIDPENPMPYDPDNMNSLCISYDGFNSRIGL